MALVGNISGSGGVSNTIGITGSLIIANPGTAVFPTFPGSDVALFVSGNIASKPATSPNLSVRGTTVFGGDVVISGTLFGGSPLYIGSFLSASQGAEIGGSVTFTGASAPKFNNGLSGSLTNLADGTSYLIAGTNISITTGSSGAITISSTGGGGGGYWIEGALNEIYSTGSVAIGTAATADSQGTDVLFFVTGSNAGGANSSSLFSGPVVISGSSVSIKGSGGISAVNLTNAGVISGSSNLQAGGSLTVAGTSSLIGVVSASSDLAVNGGKITTTASSAELFNTSATTVTIAGGATSSTTIGNATGGVTLNGTATVTGDLAVNGATSADITTTTSTATVFNTTATTVNVGGSATTVGIGASSGTTTVNNNLVVKGDLYISGTTTTIDSTVVEIQDPVIGLGFASGSIQGLAGDRGFIGGISGAGNNVAFVWSNNSGSFIAAKTTTGPGTSPVVVSNLQPIRGSKFEVGGTSTYITSSLGNEVSIVANAAAIDFRSGASTVLAEIIPVGSDTRFGASGRKLTVSGSQVFLQAAKGISNAGFTFQADNSPILTIQSGSLDGVLLINPAAGMTRTDLLNSTSTTINFGGAATALTIGAAAGTTTTVRGGTLVGNTSTQNIFDSTATKINFGGAGTDISIGLNATGATFLKNAVTNISGSLVTAGVIEANNGTVITNQTTFNLVNATATKVNFAGAGTDISIGANGTGNLYLKNATTNISGSVIVAGNTTLGDSTGDSITFTGRAASSLVPNANDAFDLGQPDLRWRNMYTGDLHLKNERGDWTIIEERDYLTITNNFTGKRYKFVLQEI